MELELLGTQYPLSRIEGSYKLPLYLSAEYEFYEITIQDIFCFVMRYKGHYLSAKHVKKHMEKVQKLLGEGETPCFLWADSLRRHQFEGLMEQKVPCYAGPYRFFLPFLGAVLTQRTESEEKEEREAFTVSQQCVFFAVLMSQETECSAKKLRERLGLSHASVSRALLSLNRRGLLQVTGNATRKVYSRPDRRTLWEKGRSALISPVMRIVYYADGVPEETKGLLAGESALAEHTLLAEPMRRVYAASKRSFGKMPQSTPDEVIQENESGELLEIWRYDPNLFCQTAEGGKRTVDPFSLYAALGEERRDERVEMELEKWIEEFFEE